MVKIHNKPSHQPVIIKPDFRQTLLQFQKDGYLCDTVLVGENGQVKAHSVVLAAVSDVLRTSLKSSDKPAEHILILPTVDVKLLTIALEYAYTDSLVLPNEFSSEDGRAKVIEVLTILGLTLPEPNANNTWFVLLVCFNHSSVI